MKIIVTGANGFIGRHLLPKLIDKGHEIIAVVRNKKKLLNCDERCKFVELDIKNLNSHELVMFKQADALIHLAWGYLSDYRSLKHIEIELPSHYHFIKKLISLGVVNISVIGTCFEYGMQSGKLSELLQTQPNNPYGYAKDNLRKQLYFLKKEKDFNLVWIRLFYMFGSNYASNSLYSQLSAAVDNNEKIFNMSGGEQLRDYLHIDDVIQGIVNIVEIKQEVGIVNVCSGKPISIRSLVEQWIESNNWNISLNLGHYPYPDYEPLAFWGDNYKYLSLVGLNK